MSNSKVIFRCEIEDDTLNLFSQIGLFKMNSNYTTVNTTNMLIINPSNVSDWTVNPSCRFRFINLWFVYSDSSMVHSFTIDEYDFNFNNTSWDQPINYENNHLVLIIRYRINILAKFL